MRGWAGRTPGPPLVSCSVAPTAPGRRPPPHPPALSSSGSKRRERVLLAGQLARVRDQETSLAARDLDGVRRRRARSTASAAAAVAAVTVSRIGESSDGSAPPPSSRSTLPAARPARPAVAGSGTEDRVPEHLLHPDRPRAEVRVGREQDDASRRRSARRRRRPCRRAPRRPRAKPETKKSPLAGRRDTRTATWAGFGRPHDEVVVVEHPAERPDAGRERAAGSRLRPGAARRRRRTSAPRAAPR